MTGYNDHQHMMDQLDTKPLRPGAYSNRQDVFDEATANPYADTMPFIHVLAQEIGQVVGISTVREILGLARIPTLLLQGYIRASEYPVLITVAGND